MRNGRPDAALLADITAASLRYAGERTKEGMTAAEIDAMIAAAHKKLGGSYDSGLVLIGEEGRIDMQPCGGTHVRSTGEIGAVAVSKIEKKGKINRRIRVVLT